MFVIIGIVVVFGCVVAGYLMEHGNLKVLVQPAELVIIGGAAVGTVLIANPLHILKAIAGGLAGAFGGSKFGKDKYLDTMKMMYELFSRARKEGLMALEADSDGPDKSPVFSKYPKFLKDHHALAFVCDTIRLAAGGGVEFADVEANLLRVKREIIREDVAIGEAKGERAPELSHQRVITVARVAEMIDPVEVVVGGVIDAVRAIELEKHSGNAEVIQEDSVVGAAADAGFDELGIGDILLI